MRELVKWPEVVSVARRWKSDRDCLYEYIYEDGAFNRLVVTDVAESWDDFLEWLNGCRNWGFRGQREASWTLQSSLERGIRVPYSYGNISGHYHLNRTVGEELLSGFRELAPLHLQDLPASDDLTGWLALMQHYGGPTRLLDWTECPFIGVYFALRKEPTERNCSAVWALDLDWLQRKEVEMLGYVLPKHDPKARIRYLNSLLSQSDKPLVIRIDQQKRSDRMIAQKGFFLWKLYEEIPHFDPILMTMMFHPEIVQSPIIRKLEVDPKLRPGFLEKLSREKNIHEASLFPGNDFCEPLRKELREMVERAKAEYDEELRSIQVG